MNPYDSVVDVLLGVFGAYILCVEYGVLPAKRKPKPWIVTKVVGAILVLGGIMGLLRLWRG